MAGRGLSGWVLGRMFGVRMGRDGWGWVLFLMFFNINILSTFIFVWCVAWVVIDGARRVSGGV